VEKMAARLMQAVTLPLADAGLTALLRLEPLRNERAPDVLTFSGGVSEYIYGREVAAFGDLGPALARAVLARAKHWGPRIEAPDQGIRATVVGASQYTVQVSGSTIFVAPAAVLPLKNVAVITPALALDAEALDSGALAGAVRTALRQFDLHQGAQPVALCYCWQGSATFARLDAFCRAMADGMAVLLARGLPLVLVGDSDVGGLVGMHCREELALACPIVSIDGIALKAFDYIDIGTLLPASGAVPVVIKSLVFPSSAAPGLRAG
jgi:ethanolamine utilization protein EutA